MIVKPIIDPWPIWNLIEDFLCDQQGSNKEVSGPFMGVFDQQDIMLGAFLIKQWSEICYEIHGGIDPKYRGQGRDIIKALGWAVFKGTPCLKIVGIVPEFNRLMRNTLIKAGMTQEGIIKKSFLKNMRLYDQYIYGICKSEVRQCQQR